MTVFLETGFAVTVSRCYSYSRHIKTALFEVTVFLETGFAVTVSTYSEYGKHLSAEVKLRQ